MPSDATPQRPLPASAPEVRQQSDPDADQFGAVAVAAGPYRWGVMHPEHGGHWVKSRGVVYDVVV